MKIRAFVIMILVMFGPFFSLVQVGSSSIDQEMTVNNNEIILTSSSPILILNDTTFDEQASTNGWQGNGSTSDPYIIEDLDINANGTGYGIGVSTTYSFIIRNCTITNASGGGSPLGGISIINGNATIHNNTISKCGYGINAGDGCIISNNTLTFNNFAIWAIGDEMTITGNNCSHNPNTGIHYQGILSLLKDNMINDNDFGIHLVGASRNWLESNTMIFNDDHGIKLDYGSNNNTVIANVAYKNDDGIMIDRGSSGNIIVNNSIKMCEEGLYVLSGSENEFYGNRMEGCSFYFGTSLGSLLPTIYYQKITLNNTVLGPMGWEPVLYIGGHGMNNASITDHALGQIIMWDVDNVSISNVNIFGGTAGIFAFNCMNITVQNCMIEEHVYDGVIALHCDRMNITSTTVTRSNVGLNLLDCDDIHVLSNSLGSNELGLGSDHVSGILVESNLFEYGRGGIWIRSQCSFSRVINNRFYDQTSFSLQCESGSNISENRIGKYPSTAMGPDDGIIIRDGAPSLSSNIIQYCKNGISIEYTDSVRIIRNTIQYCDTGIYAIWTRMEWIHDNIIKGFSKSGIHLDHSTFSDVRGNKIENNGTSGTGIFISQSYSPGLNKNILLNTSIDLYYIEGTEPPKIAISKDNTVNGEPVHYYGFEDLKDRTLPTKGGQFIFFGTQGGTLKDVEMKGGYIRVLVYDSVDLKLEDLSFRDPEDKGFGIGVKTVFSENIEINDCRFDNIKDFIVINNCLNIVILNSTFTQCTGSAIDSYFSTFEVNKCLFFECNIGVDAKSDKGSKILNSLFEEGVEGIVIDHVSKSTSVQYCGFIENHGYGVWIKEGAFVKVYDNSFIYNGRELPEGGDLRIDTKHNQVFGNYFWDHLMPDINGDGFVDIPYEGYIGENITEGNERSYLPLEILGMPLDVRISQFLGDCILNWTEPEMGCYVNLTGFTVRRIGTGDMIPLSWDVGNDMGKFVDAGVEASGEIFYSIHARSQLGDGKPMIVSINRTTTSPALSFDQMNGSIFAKDNITLSWNIEGPWEEIVSVEFSLNESDPYFSLQGAPMFFVLENVPNGWHEAKVRVRDIRGFSTFASISFLVDWEAPKVHLLEPGKWISDEVLFEWNISDNIEISRIYYELSLHQNTSSYEIEGHNLTSDLPVTTRSGDTPPSDERRLISCGNLSLHETMKKFNLTDGNYSFILTVTDIAGNMAMDGKSIGVDRTSPIVMGYGPSGENAAINGTIWIEVSEILVPHSIKFDLYGVSGNWYKRSNTTYELIPTDRLDHYVEYLARFGGRDLAGNEIGISWTFRTLKDLARKTTITGKIVDMDGKPLENAEIMIISLTESRMILSETNGDFHLDLSEGNYSIHISLKGYYNQTKDVTVPYFGGPVDIGTFSLEKIDEVETEKKFPCLMILVGIFLITITIYFAISAFTRKKGPFDEE